MDDILLLLLLAPLFNLLVDCFLRFVQSVSFSRLRNSILLLLVIVVLLGEDCIVVVSAVALLMVSSTAEGGVQSIIVIFVSTCSFSLLFVV